MKKTIFKSQGPVLSPPLTICMTLARYLYFLRKLRVMIMLSVKSRKCLVQRPEVGAVLSGHKFPALEALLAEFIHANSL